MLFPKVGVTELLLLLGLALIIFGPKKLPEIGKSLGKSINEFKRSVSTDDEKPAEGKNEDVLSKPAPETKKDNDERIE